METTTKGELQRRSECVCDGDEGYSRVCSNRSRTTMDVQTDTELNGHNADNRKIGIDVCNPLSSNYICMIRRRRGISFGRPRDIIRKNEKRKFCVAERNDRSGSKCERLQ